MNKETMAQYLSRKFEPEPRLTKVARAVKSAILNNKDSK